MLIRIFAHVFLAMAFSSCATLKEESTGVGITGIDHLADHVSVQDFWVNGYNAAQAGKGGRTVCCASLPKRWHHALKVQVRWDVADWRTGRWSCYVSDVPVARYTEAGQLWVHFLPDGQVKVLSSNEGPRSRTYPGPRDPIPQKHPWDLYPPPPADPGRPCSTVQVKE
jgi:hypothetical protein